MAFDPQLQRRIMGKFGTGVTVASTCVGETTWGMTANAVTSVSLTPPLVLLCVARDSQSHRNITQGGCFALSILSAEDQAISDRFAFTGPKDFSGLETHTAETGSPILASAIGWVDCKLRDVFPGGDHDILVGEILAGDFRDAAPLLYFDGGYAQLP